MTLKYLHDSNAEYSVAAMQLLTGPYFSVGAALRHLT